jgi:hypothetical protein
MFFLLINSLSYFFIKFIVHLVLKFIFIKLYIIFIFMENSNKKLYFFLIINFYNISMINYMNFSAIIIIIILNPYFIYWYFNICLIILIYYFINIFVDNHCLDLEYCYFKLYLIFYLLKGIFIFNLIICYVFIDVFQNPKIYSMIINFIVDLRVSNFIVLFCFFRSLFYMTL